jgi:dipeptidyl aminopeptidase/acylaminoacyl peptidase
MTPLDRLRQYATRDDQRVDLPRYDQLPMRSPSRRKASAWLGLIAGLAALTLVVVSAVAVSQLRAGAPIETAAPTTPTSAPPTALATPSLAVNVPAFRAQGRLAFSTGQSLHVLDGISGEFRPVGRAGLAAWSRNGDWLAFQQTVGPSAASASLAELWLASADGTGKTKVTGLPPLMNLIFTWSPTEDVLAVMPQGGADAKGLWLVRPDGIARLMAAGDVPVWSFAWSPDGRTIAYSRTLPFTDPIGRSDALFTVPISGGPPTQRLVASNAGILGIAWAPDGLSLLYYDVPQHSGSMLMDGVPLKTLALSPSRRSGAFPDKKIDFFDEWIDAHRFIAVIGGSRFPTANKTLAICDLDALSCAPIASQTGTVSLQPALSSDRTRVAFIRAAENLGIGFSSEAAAAAWMQSKTLWIVDLRTGAAQELAAAGRGVSIAAWSRDDLHLLVTRDRAAWIYDLVTQSSTKLIEPLDAATPFGGPGWSFAWQR